MHSLRTIEGNADRDVEVNYDVIFYKVQTRDFLHIAEGSLNIPALFVYVITSSVPVPMFGVDVDLLIAGKT